MNIGIDVKVLAKRLTGIGVYVKEMVRFFNEVDHEDQFYLFTNKKFKLNFELGENFHQIIVNKKLKSLGIIFCMERYLKQYQINVFWGTEHIVPWTSFCKTVITIHDLAVLMDPKLGTRKNALIQKLFTIPSCKRADKVIAISKSTKNDVVRLCNINDNKVVVINNGDSPYKGNLHQFTTKEVEEIHTKFYLNKDYFLFVGTIEPRKNIPTIVKAFDVFKNNSDHHQHQLVLVGGLGWRYKESLQAIQNSPYKNCIILTGYCSNLEREYLYRNAKALLFPSLYEGFGLPIIEGMSVGLPIITADNSSLKEIGGDAAFYIKDALDYNSLAKIMENVDSLGEVERKSIIEKSKTRANMFSRKKCAEETLEFIKNI